MQKQNNVRQIEDDFCAICGAILEKKTFGSRIMLECLSCRKTYEPKADDAKFYEFRETDSDYEKNINIIRSLPYLQFANKTTKINCIKCNYTPIISVPVGENMDYYFACSMCEEIWTNVNNA